MADFGVTTTGFARKTETDCFEEIIEEARAGIHPELDDSEDTVHGAQARIVASKAAELWEVGEDTYNGYSANASGDQLDIVCSLTGTVRESPSYSVTTAQVEVDPGTYNVGTIIAKVDDDEDARFISTGPAVNLGAAVAFVPVTMQADKTGPVRAPSGHLTVLENPPVGVHSITNAADADLGADTESDADLRVRRLQELAGAGKTTVGATRALLARVEGVTESYVYTNRGDAPDSAGRPGHCIEAVVLGGDDDEIAQTIWRSIAGGINPYSATGNSGTAIDEEGNAQNIAFSRAAERRLWVRVSLKRDPVAYAGDAAVGQMVSDFTDGTVVLSNSEGDIVRGDVQVGGIVYGGKIGAAVQTVPGVLGIEGLQLADNAGFAGAVTDYQLGIREYLGFSGTRGISSGDVTVVIV